MLNKLSIGVNILLQILSLYFIAVDKTDYAIFIMCIVINDSLLYNRRNNGKDR